MNTTVATVATSSWGFPRRCAWVWPLLLICCLSLWPRPLFAQGATFTITNTGDSGAGSLRQAITDANNSGVSPRTIVFNIPTIDPGFDGNVFTIQSLSDLPILLGNIDIDGATQTAFTGDSNPLGPEILLESGHPSALSGLVISSDNNRIAGLTINKFPDYGIGIVYSVDTTPSNNRIEDNYLGTDPTGTIAQPNELGVGIHGYASPSLQAADNVIEDNLISGNERWGINLCDARHTVVRHNLIGTDRLGVNNLGNGQGIFLQCAGAPANLIEDNIIAFSKGSEETTGDGIRIDPDYRFAIDGHEGTTIRGNSIYSNAGLGINLLPAPYQTIDDVTANDTGDVDVGGNRLQNFPVLQAADSNGVATAVTGTLNSIANQTYTLEFFANDIADPLGYGEGQRSLGVIDVTTDATGNASFFAVLPAGVWGSTSRMTATATDAAGNTSEFSPQIPIARTASNRTQTASTTITAVSATWLTAYALFAGDANRNNYLICEFATDPAGPWDQLSTTILPGDTTWRYCVVTGLTPDKDYYVRTTVVDPDGVDGATPQILGPIHTNAAASDSAVVGDAKVTVEETHLLVSVPIEGDANRNSGLDSVSIASEPSGPWTLKCSPELPVSPILCRIHGLTSGNSYWVRIIVADPDLPGPDHTHTQIIGPVLYTGLQNLALGKSVSADPAFGCCTNPAEMVDGSIQDPVWTHGYAFTGGTAGWGGGAPGWKQATIDLGAAQPVARLDWWPHQSTAIPRIWRVEVSMDGLQFSEVYTTTQGTCLPDPFYATLGWGEARCSQQATFEPITARYVRYSFDDRSIFDGMHGWTQELEIFGPVDPVAMVEVPNVVGMTQAASEAAITAAQLIVGAITPQSSTTVPAGNIISQNPAANISVAQGSQVDLVVSSGPPLVQVPNVVGMTQAASEAAITAAQLTVGAITPQSSTTVPAGNIMSQNPAAGISIVQGSQVDLVVSSGPPLVQVPNLLGKSQSEAESEIENAKLTIGDILTQPSNSTPVGHVFGQTPVSGAVVVEGSQVDLVISSGPDGNDSCNTATAIEEGISVQAPLDAAGDIDFYRITVDQPNSTVIVTLQHPDRDYDISVYDTCTNPSSAPKKSGQARHVGGEYVAFTIGNGTGVYYLAISGYHDAFSATPYTLQIEVNPDTDEPNDSCIQAVTLLPGEEHRSYLSYAADLDYYKVAVPVSYSTVTVRLHHARANYDLSIDQGCVGGTGQARHVGESLADEVVLFNIGAITGTYSIAVRGAIDIYDTEPYTIEVEVTPPPGYGTLLLVNRARMENLYGVPTTTQLYAKLEQLANHPAVMGLIVNLDDDAAVRTAYSAWDAIPSSPSQANKTAEAIKRVIEARIQDFPGIRYLVLVGSDWTLPFYRLPIVPYAANNSLNWMTENSYVTSFGKNWNTSNPDPTLAALISNNTLSDDFYAAGAGIPFQGHYLYLPARAVGRLVETPQEIIAVMDAFLAANGASTASRAIGIGSDFLIDSAVAACTRLDSDGITTTCQADNNWGPDVLKDSLNANDWDLATIQTHANHYQFIAPSSGTVNAAAPGKGVLLYSLGCQAGLNVFPGSPGEFDWAEASASRGVNFVGNTGWGYGLADGMGLSETLLDLYTTNLVQGQTATLGEALMNAKRTYYMNEPTAMFDHYDEKILSELTLYGLPMWRIISGSSVLPSAQVAAALINMPAALAQVSIAAAGPTVEDRHLYVSADDLVKRTTQWGQYFAYQGESAHADPGLPFQPRYVASTYANSGPIHGALLLSASYSDTPDFDPVVAAPVVPGAESQPVEPQVQAKGWTPGILVSLQQLPSLYDSSHEQTLVIALGQYLAASNVERLYHDVEVRIYRSDSDDWSAPTITSVRTDAAAEGKQLHVIANDPSGIATVVAAYTSGDGYWHNMTLESAGDDWQGVLPPTASSYLVQAVDMAGNVAAFSSDAPPQNSGAVLLLPIIER